MYIKQSYLLAILLVLALSSCKPTYYIPNTHNVPLLSKKNDLVVSFGAQEYLLDFQAAYGLTQNFGLMGNIGSASWKDGNDDGSASYIEFGGGYFKTFRKHIVCEVYGLLATGKIRFNYVNLSPHSTGAHGEIRSRMIRSGIQTNVGLKYNHFSLALSNRVMHLNYHSIKGQLIYSNVDQQDYLKNNKSNFLIEPAATIKLGFKNISVFGQIGASYNLSNPEFEQKYEHLSLGITMNLSKMFKLEEY